MMIMGDFGAVNSKVYKKLKSQPHCRIRMKQIGLIFTDQDASAFHHFCSSLKNPASETKVSAFIRVHSRFIKNVFFQTGLTGSTGFIFNPVYPVILSNLKCQLSAPWLSAMVREDTG